MNRVVPALEAHQRQGLERDDVQRVGGCPVVVVLVQHGQVRRERDAQLLVVAGLGRVGRGRRPLGELAEHRQRVGRVLVADQLERGSVALLGAGQVPSLGQHERQRIMCARELIARVVLVPVRLGQHVDALVAQLFGLREVAGHLVEQSGAAWEE